MKDYTAWIKGSRKSDSFISVAHGTLSHVRKTALAIIATAQFREWEQAPFTLKITRGARQTFVSSTVHE